MASIKNLFLYKILREIYWWATLFFSRPSKKLSQRIKDATKDHFHEKRLGIKTEGGSPIMNDMAVFKDSARYEPTPYDIIDKVLEFVLFNDQDVFVDFGSGKGRVIFSVATKKLKKVIGIEIRQDLVEIAKNEFKKSKNEKNTSRDYKR